MGQLCVRAHAHKNSFRAIELQFAAVGSIARKNQFDPAAVSRKGLVGADGQIQVFLCGQPTNRQENHGVFVGLPLRSQIATALTGMEQLCVNASGHHAQVVKTNGLQLGLECARGHHGAMGPVVKFAQISHDGFAQPPYAVVFAVAVKIGAKVRGDR